jgi:ribosome recycling factor
MTEDDYKLAEKEIQNLTDKFIKDVDAESAKKEKELLEI